MKIIILSVIDSVIYLYFNRNSEVIYIYHYGIYAIYIHFWQ